MPYTNRQNAIRAARKSLGAAAQVERDFTLSQSEAGFDWAAAAAAPEAAAVAPAEPALSAEELTTKETAVLVAIATNYYDSGNGAWGSTWANTINDAHKPSGIEGKALGGVVASLQKKGFLHCSHDGKDAVVCWSGEAAYAIGRALADAPAAAPAAEVVAAPAPAAPAPQPEPGSMDAIVLGFVRQFFDRDGLGGGAPVSVGLDTVRDALEAAYSAGHLAGHALAQAEAKPAHRPRAGNKRAIVAELLTRAGGCTTREILDATGWPSVSVPQQAAASGLTLEKSRAKGEPTRYFGRAASV